MIVTIAVFDLCDRAAAAYNEVVEHPGDIGKDRTVAAQLPTSGALFLAIRDVLLAVKNLVIDKVALQRGDLASLRQIASLFIFALMFVIRHFAIWRDRAIANARATIIRAERNIHHPPQTWAAP